jgi:trehalose 6-phosphate phosphatase
MTGAVAKAPVSSSAFFLDVDGTLLEITARPEDVAADAPLRALLLGLHAAANGAVAFVSGRAIAAIDQIFSPLRFSCAGLHGAEIRFADGTHAMSKHEGIESARPQCLKFVAAHPGAVLEDKGASFAVHFRQRPELATDVRAFLGQFARHGLVVQEGKLVAELRDARFSKATAIEALMATPPFAGRTPVFVGDDATDESGFGFVNVMGGLSIKVGPIDAATSAQFRARDPAEVRNWLGSLSPSRLAK